MTSSEHVVIRQQSIFQVTAKGT